MVFKGLKVIELASVLAGPAVGMFFAELGAEVIKIENKRTGGDVTRRWKTPNEDPADSYSAYYHSVNWGKQSLILDLRDKTDYRQVLSLIKKADIVVGNYKPGSASALGLDAPTLLQLNPRLIYANINAYGRENSRPGFDVVIQAETGWMYMNGEKDGPPVKMPVALIDVLAAHQLKEGILVALLERYKTGKGAEVSVSLFDTGVASLTNQASNWLNAGHLPRRIGSQHPNIAPYGDVFYTKDQKAFIVAPGVEKQVRGLFDCLELSFLKADPRFTTNADRLLNRVALNEYLADAFLKFNAEEIQGKCDQKQVPIAPIRNLAELFQLPAAQRLILEAGKGDKKNKRVKTAIFEIHDVTKKL